MAINPLMLPQIIGMGGQQPQMQQPMAPQPMQQPQAPQGPDSLAELTRLLGGDLSGSLTGGDKLLALSGLLRSATRSGRRAGLTPEQVIGGLQQRKVAEVQNRLAIEQQRAQMAQAQRAKALREQMRGRLTPEQQGQFDLLSDQQVAAMAGKQLEGQLMPSQEQRSSIARQITEATGFQVGSPEHSALMQQYLSQPRFMTTPEGIVQTPGLAFTPPQPQAQAQPQSGSAEVSTEDFMRVVRSRPDPQAAVEWATRNNVVVRPATPQEARMLPSGTPIMLPDGTMGRVP